MTPCTRRRENVFDCMASTHQSEGNPSATAPSKSWSDLCYHKEVRVEVKGQDRYQRTIAEVVLSDGLILNYEIVKAGLAWWFKRYSPKDPTLEGLEFQARQARRGVWSDHDPVPPCEFRRNKPEAYRWGA